MTPRGAFLLFTDHFMPAYLYDELTHEAIIQEAVTALTPEERDLAAAYLEELLQADDAILFAAWDRSNGSVSPTQDTQRAFSQLAVERLRDESLPFIESKRIIYTEES